MKTVRFKVIGATTTEPVAASSIAYSVRVDEGGGLVYVRHGVKPPSGNRPPDAIDTIPALGFVGRATLGDDGAMTFDIREYPAMGCVPNP